MSKKAISDMADDMINHMIEMDVECSTKGTLYEILADGATGYNNMSNEAMADQYEQYCDTFDFETAFSKDLLARFRLLITTDKVL